MRCSFDVKIAIFPRIESEIVNPAYLYCESLENFVFIISFSLDIFIYKTFGASSAFHLKEGNLSK